MRYKRKTKQKNMECNSMPKNWMCAGTNEKQKVKIPGKQITLLYLN